MKINEMSQFKNIGLNFLVQTNNTAASIFNGYFSNDVMINDNLGMMYRNNSHQYLISDNKYGVDENGIYYEVKSGDNLSKIAEKLGLTISQLRAFNTNLDVDNLNIGQKIYFRGEMYKIKRGDTLSQIAVQYGVTVADLKKWNNLTDNSIKEGKYLLIVTSDDNSAEQNTRTTATPEISRTSASASESGGNSLTGTVHTVVSGDTLSGIAQRYGVPQAAIEEANPNLTSPDRLSLGQQIRIPAAEENASVTLEKSTEGTGSTDNQSQEYQCIHTVKKGESIATIKRKYGVTEQQILDANTNLKKTGTRGNYQIFINVGDKLNIPFPEEKVILSLSDLSQEERDFLTAVTMRESSGRYWVTSRSNGQGFLGLYQMGEGALTDIGVYSEDSTPGINDWRGVFRENDFGITSKSDFLNNPEKQHKAIIAYTQFNWVVLNQNIENLESYIGRTINGVKITKSGLLAGAHLLGPGNVKIFLTTSDPETLSKLVDANGTHISEYMTRFGGYEVSHFTSGI